MGMFGTEWAMWDAKPSAPPTPTPSTGPAVQPSRPLHRMRGVPQWRPPPPPPAPPPPPEPPQLSQGSSLSVDDAWGIFGIAKKRATKAEVKRRYRDFVANNHPDSGPESERAVRNTKLMQANLAFTLLEKHCKW